MTTMDNFPMVSEQDKGLLNDDGMLAFANELLQSSSAPEEVHTHAVGQQLSALTADLSCDDTRCDAGHAGLETLNASFPFLQAPAMSTLETLSAPPGQLFHLPGQAAMLPFGQAAYFLPAGSNLQVSQLPMCPPICPPKQPSMGQPLLGRNSNVSSLPLAGYASDTHSNVFFDLSGANAQGAGAGLQNITVQTPGGQWIQAQIVQPFVPPVHHNIVAPPAKKFKASSVSFPASPAGFNNTAAVPLNLAAVTPQAPVSQHPVSAPLQPSLPPVVSVGKASSKTLKRFQLLAHELYGQIAEDQKSELNQLHQQAKDSKDPPSAEAATRRFWQKWYDYAPAHKVNEFRQLMSEVMGQGAGAEVDKSMQMPVSKQDSNHSTNDNKDDGKLDVQLDFIHQDTADTMLAKERRTGVQSLITALTEYDRSYNQRLTNMENAMRQLEANLMKETAARMNALNENARLADEVKRLQGVLLQLQHHQGV